jgi:hypothetical protein
MDEQDVKKRLKSEVSALDLEPILEELVDRGAVEAVCNGTKLYEHLREEAEDLANFQRRDAARTRDYTDSRPGRSPGPLVEAELNERERAYADTRSRWLELVGRRQPEVVRFREKVLLEELLSSEDALVFVESPLAGYASLGWFESEGVPMVDHTARVVNYELPREDGLARGRHERVVFRIDPPGRTVEMKKRGGGPAGRKPFALQVRADDGLVEITYVERGSVLYDLHRVSVVLAGRLGADEAGATRFVLTGEWPPAPPLDAELKPGAIVLAISPWVSEKTLRRFFLQLQRRYREGDNRPLSDKALAALLFVTEHADEHGRHPSFEKLTPLWNKRYPEWRFKSRFGLRDAYHRAAKVVVPAPPG